MRAFAIVGLGLALASSALFAQQQPQTYKVKPYRAQAKKPAQVTPLAKMPNAATDEAKDLRRIEKEAAKTSGGVNSTGAKRASGSANVFKPEKSKPVPPINAGSGGMGTNMKGTGMTNQGTNPYRGRLRQKGSRQ